MEDFGKLIKRERTRQGMTQEVLGDKACTTKEAVGFIERNQRNPRMDTLESILDALGYELKAVKKR